MAITLLNSPTANAIGPTVNKNAAVQNKSLLELSTGTRLVYPSSDPAAAAMTNVIKANVAVVGQCVKNADQGAALTNVASSGLTDLIALNTQGQVLCAQVINGSLDTESRAIAQRSIEAMFGKGGSTEAIIKTCRFGDKALLNGEKVSSSPTNQTGVNIDTQVLNTGPAANIGTGLAAAPAATVVLADTIGVIDGRVTACHVALSGNATTNSNLKISMTVGGYTYVAPDVPATAGTVWNLICPETQGVITLTGGTGAPITPAALQADMDTFFKPAAEDAAVFHTGSLHSGAAGVAGISITGTADLSPGVYAIGVYTPTGGALTLVVSNGASGAIAAPAAGGANVLMGGKLTVTLPATPAALSNYKITVKNELNLSFQTGSQPTDQTQVYLSRVDLESLHYTNMDVTTMEAAASTTEKLKYGMGVLNDILAQIGASQQRLITAGTSASTLEENMKNASSTFSDANPIASMIEFQQSSILLNNAIASTTPSMSSLRSLSNQIQQTFSSVG